MKFCYLKSNIFQMQDILAGILIDKRSIFIYKFIFYEGRRQIFYESLGHKANFSICATWYKICIQFSRNFFNHSYYMVVKFTIILFMLKNFCSEVERMKSFSPVELWSIEFISKKTWIKVYKTEKIKFQCQNILKRTI